jgi:DNA-nicking Smr family endonuclease
MRKPVAKKTPVELAHDFRDAVRDVKPLPPATIPAGLAKPKPRPRARVATAALRAEADLRTGIKGYGPPAIESDALPDETLSFRRAGIQDQLFKKLRRGLIPAQAQIDLHGLTQQVAWDCLMEFIGHSRDENLRCIRVIHGKGHRSGTRGPVLKSAVNTWLRRSHDVVAFTSARAIDGGAGALYVLLRA